MDFRLLNCGMSCGCDGNEPAVNPKDCVCTCGDGDIGFGKIGTFLDRCDRDCDSGDDADCWSCCCCCSCEREDIDVDEECFDKRA